MGRNSPPTQEDLRRSLSYDPDSGRFTWLRGKLAGQEAGYIHGAPPKRGYRVIEFQGRNYMAHRLAMLWMTGQWPDEVDHRNGRRHDNCWDNLRAATREGNAQNKAVQSNSRSGVRGINWYPRFQKWRASRASNGKRQHLGYFATIEQATEARRAAELAQHGEFAASRRDSARL